MKLKPVDITIGVANDGVRRIFGSSKRTESNGHLGDLITMTVPDIERRRELVEKRALGVALEFARPVFTLRRAFHLTTQSVSDELHAITNTQHGNTEFIDGAIDLRCFGCINTRWTAGEYDSSGFELRDGGRLRRVGNDFGVDLALAHTAGNHLRVLRPEIENEDFVPRSFSGHDRN